MDHAKHDLRPAADPWTFTGTITISNWEAHPEWNEFSFDPKGAQGQILVNAPKEKTFICNAKRLLNNYDALGYNQDTKTNYFIPSQKWIEDKFYPIVLSDELTRLYQIRYPFFHPVLTKLNCSELLRVR